MAKEASESRANRWLQLSTMLGAGIAPATAVKSLTKIPHRDNQAFARVADLLARGQSMSAALQRSKFLSKHDLASINNAEKVGQLADGFDYIAHDHLTRFRNRRSLETSFLLPQVILLIAAIAALSIRIFQYGQSLISAIVEVSVVVIVCLLATRLFMVLWSLNSRVWLSWLWPITIIKRNSVWFQNHFEYHFYRHLNWQLGASVSAAEALQNCDKLISNTVYQQQLRNAADSAASGQSISASLINADLVLSVRMGQAIMVGHETGVFDSSLKSELSWLKSKIEARTQEQIKWLPKVYYFMVVVVVFTYLF